MGNKSSCSLNTDNDELSDYDIAIYNIKRRNVFLGTIAICIIYAIIALILFLGGYFSEKVRFILLNRFLPFTVIYIIGTIVIVLYLAYQVYYFKPIKIDTTNDYDPISCPDYWKLEKVDLNKDEHSGLFDPKVNMNLFKYRCVLNNNIFDKQDIAATPNKNYKITNVAVDTNGGVNNDIATGFTKNTTDEKNVLYKNLFDTTNNNMFYSNVAKTNLDKLEFIKHNLIMNNYSKDPNNDKKYNYNIDNDTKKTNADKVNIYPITYDIDTTITKTRKDQKDLTHLTLNEAANGTLTATSGSSHTLSSLPIVCDRVYPLYLATKDIELSKNNSKLDKNVLRCAYSKICGMPWTDLNCGKYNN